MFIIGTSDCPGYHLRIESMFNEQCQGVVERARPVV
jgi:hypothetical protein